MQRTVEIMIGGYPVRYVCEADTDAEAREKAQKFAAHMGVRVDARGLMHTDMAVELRVAASN
jgi:hypothetical protein